MKNRKLSVLLVICIILSFTIGVNADQIITNVTAIIDKDLKLTFDGKAITPKDVKGNEVPILVYEGSSYLPVRSVANLAGLEVGWDGNTKTIKLTKPRLEPISILDTEYIINPENTNENTYHIDTSVTKDKTVTTYSQEDEKIEYDRAIFFDTQGKSNATPEIVFKNNGYNYLSIATWGNVLRTYPYKGGFTVKIEDADTGIVLWSRNFPDEGLYNLENSKIDISGVENVKITTYLGDNFIDYEVVMADLTLSQE